jgi:hypothetical protein
MECLQKLSKPNRCQATNYQKPPKAYVVNIYGINLLYFFNSYTKNVIIYILKKIWSKYQCKYGPKDYQENSTHIWSIKRRCLASFSIKRLYTQHDVANMKIYHKAHTWTNGSFAHGEHDLKSIFRISRYAPHMSQALKDHIWAQLSLGYMTKQIYDKHKVICGNVWMRVKAWHKMISFGFKTLHIWIRNIRKGVGIYTPTLQFQFGLGLSNIQKMCSSSKMLVKSTRLKSHSP